MKDARGPLGKVVYFKQLRGKTVMCNWPRKPDKSRQTDAQRVTRHTFKEAAQYAKNVLKNDPALKAYYGRKAKSLGLPNAYTAALTDYMRRGRVESVNRKKYTGKIGGKIMVVVRKKDFSVREVWIALSHETGEPIESGRAVKDKDGNWVYRNTVAVRHAEAVVLQVRAIDIDGRPV